MKIVELFEENESLAQLLAKNCAPFIRQISASDLLLRGITKQDLSNPKQVHLGAGNSFVNLLTIAVRKNRRPLTTPPQIHQELDDWFLEKFHWRARSEGMFAAGESFRESVVAYGTPFAVFPIGEFKFIWSPDVYDLYDTVLDARKKDQLIRPALDSSDYRSTDLEAAIASGNEIVFKCDKYYAIKLDSGIRAEVLAAKKILS